MITAPHKPMVCSCWLCLGHAAGYCDDHVKLLLMQMSMTSRFGLLLAMQCLMTGGIQVGQQVLEAASCSSLVGAFTSPPAAVVVLEHHQLPLRQRCDPEDTSRDRTDADSSGVLRELLFVNSHVSANLDFEMLLPQVTTALAEQYFPLDSTVIETPVIT